MKPVKLKDIKDPDEFIPTRQSLLNRLKDWQDNESWRDFFHTYWKLIYGMAIKSGLSDLEAQEVVQETVITVSKQMPGFKYDPTIGTFKAWLLKTTSWRIKDHLRKRAHNPAEPMDTGDTSAETPLVNTIPDPAVGNLDAVWDEEWQKNLIDAAIQRVKTQVRPKQYQIFDLSVIKDWPITKVTSTLGVNVAQVYLARHRVANLIKKEVKRLEKEFERQC